MLNLDEAATLLAAGGIVIYPTETFFALGCVATLAAPVRAIFAIKGRPPQKPLPILAADMAQARQVAHVEEAPGDLLELFWPGPLTLLLAAKKNLAPELINPQHKAALRITAGAVAARLARAAQGCLTASSANISGFAPVARLAELDPGLIAACHRSGLPWGILGAEQPGGNLPSTVAEPIWTGTQWQLRILRHGQIPADQLQQWNPI